MRDLLTRDAEWCSPRQARASHATRRSRRAARRWLGRTLC